MDCKSINNCQNIYRSHFPTVFNDFKQDYIKFTSALEDSINFSEQSTDTDLVLYFNTIKSKQGIVGKSWDYIKNKLNMKNSSNSVEIDIKKYENQEIPKEQLQQSIDKYTKGQTKALDFVADWGTVLVSAAAFSIALPLCTSGLPAALGVAAISGGFTKMGVKYIDAKTGNRKYNTSLYDSTTGAINGLLSPIVDGLGNSATKCIAKKFGIKTICKNSKAQLLSKYAKNLTEKIILCPKQKLVGNNIQKGISALSGKGIKSSTKFALSLGLREITFKYFEFTKKNPFFNPNLLIANNIVNKGGIFHKKNKNQEDMPAKSIDLDTSNNVYDAEINQSS